ncbi:MAG TPA: orotate phosphoribosyltransferase [Terriglobia bacterium]|nr:orotate phosphoribosyltransferase [Terriglobia bacterium]
MSEKLSELSEIIRRKSLRRGDFVLASGRRANYYLDCRMTTLDPRGATLIARLLLEKMRELNIEADAIGGLTMGADPIAAATAVISEIEGRPLPAFIVRKETKGHGMQRAIEGWDGKPGAKVVVVDDVCTSGESILTACRKAEEAGYKVAATFCVVDREEGGTETISKQYPFYPLLTARQLLEA